MNWSSPYRYRMALAVAISPDTTVLFVSAEGTCCSLILQLHVDCPHGMQYYWLSVWLTWDLHNRQS